MPARTRIDAARIAWGVLGLSLVILFYFLLSLAAERIAARLVECALLACEAI